jgi:hypothetical protein
MSTVRNSIDSRSNARKTIEYEHASIHDERGFDCDIEFTLSTTTPKYYHIKTGADEIHLKDLIISTNKPEVKVWLYKNPTVTLNASPTQETLHNSDDDSVKTCSMKVYNNSTITNDGTIRKVYYLAGSSGNGHSSAGEVSAVPFWEFIMNPNSDYLIKILRLVSDGDTTGVLKLRLYVEDEYV